MSRHLLCSEELSPETKAFYQRSIATLLESEIPFLAGGGYAFEAHTGIKRQTKDFDIFVMPHDVDRVLAILARDGCRTEITYPHWLGKAYCGADFIDVIYNSGNAVCPVDDEWFEHATEAEVFGLRLKLCPAEETIWQKAFIMERARYDGADVAHFIHAKAETLDWHRLLRRFGEHWRVLFSHLTLFGFIYPGQQHRIPGWVMDELAGRMCSASHNECGSAGPLCRGTLLSSLQYIPDTHEWGYGDGRLKPDGGMTPADLATWMQGFEKEKHSESGK